MLRDIKYDILDLFYGFAAEWFTWRALRLRKKADIARLNERWNRSERFDNRAYFVMAKRDGILDHLDALMWRYVWRQDGTHESLYWEA